MRVPAAVSLLVSLMLGAPAIANDSMATLGAGGLIFVQTADVKMLSEDLYVSPTEVRVKYEFRNEGATDTDTLVAFPLPDITGDGDFMVAIPTEDANNIFGFQTTFDGKPVEATLHQYAFSTNIDYTDYLTGLGVPLEPYGAATISAIDALDDAQKRELFHRGLAVPMEYDAGQGMTTEYYPTWTLKSTYSWEAHFPAGKTVSVEHKYKPSVGGTVAVTFLAEPYDNNDPAATYKKKYCTDDTFIKSVEKTLANPEDRYSAPYTESWLSYVWSTGANWSGPIGKFHLTVDKGSVESLVSFCWDGQVTKTSPTTFEMEATDWWPPYDRELEILILNRLDPVPPMENNVG